MFRLVNGVPLFFKGTINGQGFVDEDEKLNLIELAKEVGEDILEESLNISQEYKEKVVKIASNVGTLSSKELLKYVNGEKILPDIAIPELSKRVDLQELSSAETVMELVMMSDDNTEQLQLSSAEMVMELIEMITELQFEVAMLKEDK